MSLNMNGLSQSEREKNKSNLKHRMDMPSGRLYECTVCEKSFKVMGNLRKHMRIHSGDAAYSCSVCGKCFSHTGNLNRHRRVHTGEKPFQCFVCDKSFNVKENLATHMSTHTGEKAFECPDCGRRFSDKSGLNRHMKIHTGEKSYECSVCKKLFSRRESLKQHIRRHFGERPHECSDCGKCFIDSGNLASHKRSQAEWKVCKETFPRTRIVKRHRRTQIGEKPYGCSECDKYFSDRDALRRHMRIHMGEEDDDECAVDEKSFGQNADLKIDTKTQTGEKPYDRGQWVKGFLSAVIQHMLVHMREKPYQCDECGKCFAQSSYLKEHKLTHSKEKPFPCHVCSLSFTTASELEKHHMTVKMLESESLTQTELYEHSIRINAQKDDDCKYCSIRLCAIHPLPNDI